MVGVTPVCTKNGIYRARRIIGGGCLVAAVATTIAACSTVAGPRQRAGHGGHGEAATLSAARAVALAGQTARRIRSMTMTETMVMLGLPTGSLGIGFPAAGGGTGQPGATRAVFTERMKLQLKPALRMQMSMHAGMPGHRFAMGEILTSGAMYIKAPGMLPRHGKPWGEVKLSDLPSGMRPGVIMKKIESGNPLAGLSAPTAQAKLLADAEHLRVVHGQVVNGIPTTEYAGTLPISKFLSMISGSGGQPLTSAAPKALRQAVLPFRIWIDAKHQVRRLVMATSFHGVSMQVTINVTAINKPVRITPPPASEVTAVPVP